jgi:hypothetical protein
MEAIHHGDELEVGSLADTVDYDIWRIHDSHPCWLRYGMVCCTGGGRCDCCYALVEMSRGAWYEEEDDDFRLE